MKQYIKNNVDTQLNNQCFGRFNVLDNVELEIKVLTNGDVGEAWEQPTFELIGVKMDKNEVRQTEGFEVLSLTEHAVKVALDEQFTTKDGVLDMQLVVKDNGRVSTCIFSFIVGKSLEGNIVESIRKIDTLDNLDVVVANLRDYEQQIDQINTEVVATNEDIKIEEAKRKQDELVRVTKETARANAEAIRQVNEEMRIALYRTAAPSEEERQANEETRMVNETNRKIAEQTRISNENSRILAEQNRNETFETNEGVRNLQENKRAANENARINKFGEFEKNEIIRLASENNRLIQEIERVNNEENRINAEANRQAQENNREATYTRFNEKEKERQKAEDARQVAEQQRVNAELLRDQNYAKAETNRNKLYEDCEAQRNADFGEAETIRHETYTASEKERYTAYNQAELTRNQNEELRKNNESKRITNENKRIANEELRVQKEATRDAKVEEFLTRGEQTVIEIEQRTEEFLTRGEQVVSDIEKRTDAALGILEGSAEEVADMRIDYMGNTHDNMRQAANANVDYAVKTAIGEFNYLDYEGQHVTANNSIEGHAKSAILKGNTLVNCIIDSSRNGYININGNITMEDDGWLTIKATTGNNHFELKMDNLNIKPSTKYLLVIECESNSFQGNNHHNMSIGNTYQNVVDSPWVENLQIKMLPVGISTYMLTTKSDFSILNNPIGCRSYVGVGTGTTKFRYMIIEYQEGMENWDIPYFEGMTSVKMPVLTTTGKNLFNYDSLILNKYQNNSTFNYSITDNAEHAIYKLDVKANTTYSLNMMRNGVFYDINNQPISWFSTANTVTTPNNCKYMIINFTDYATNDYTEIQIEESSVVTTYEPYKSNILTVNEEVELRKVGNVQDELSLLTGELTQRIGEIVLDGSDDENWSILNYTLENTVLFKLTVFDMLKQSPKINSILSDKFRVDISSPYGNDSDFIFPNEGLSNNFVIRISKNKLESYDVSGFRKWLIQNNVKVQYRLATESIKTVDLSDNVVYSYDEVTHYDCSSEIGSLVPTLAVKVPTNVNAVISNQRTTIQEQTEQINTLEEENALLIEQNEMQDVEIALNQEAINFMLFEAMGMSTLNENGGNPMAAYFANQIIKRKLNYTQVVNKYPQFKEDIDLILIAEGYGDLIVE